MKKKDKKQKPKHSEQFYEKRFEELQQYAENAGIPFPYHSIDEFQSDWDAFQKAGSKQVFREVKYALKYNTPYKTALAEKRMLKELGLEDKSLEDLKKMTTQEFANKYKDEIMESYQQKHDKKLREGATPLEARAYARRYLSEYWFGSM